MMKKLFFLCLLVFFSVNVFSQQKNHVPDCPLCRYSKDNSNQKAKQAAIENCGCPACSEINKKETAARKAEDKKREEARIAKQKAENDAKQKAWAAERAKKAEEEKARIKASQVVINKQSADIGSKPPVEVDVSDARTKIISKKDHSRSTLYSKQVGDWAYLLSETGDTVLKSTAFDVSGQSWEGGNNFSFTYNKEKHGFPPNVAIVRFILSQQKTDYGTITDYSYNLIDSKGKKLVDESKKITMIKYCGYDFFMLYTCSSGGDCKMIFDNSDSQGAHEMILYDAKLNKRYVYNAKNDVSNCKINRRVTVTNETREDKEQNTGVQGLFRFIVASCEHKKNEKGYFTLTNEYIEVGMDRVPRMVFVKHGKSGYINAHE